MADMSVALPFSVSPVLLRMPPKAWARSKRRVCLGLLLLTLGLFLSNSPGWAARTSSKPADTRNTLPPFSFSECLALLDEDPSGVEDYVASHATAGDERAVRHCSALSNVLLGNAPLAAEELDRLARDRRRGPQETEDSSPEERADVAADAARAWLAADQPGKAVASSDYGLELEPESVVLHLLKARAFLRLKEPEQALGVLSALGNDPILSSETHRLRASAELALNQPEQANRDVALSLAADPDDPAALLDRGIIRQRLNDLAGAQADWQRVIDLAPDSHEADLARQDLDVLAADPDALPPSHETVSSGMATASHAATP